jgi:hypothetical protein
VLDPRRSPAPTYPSATAPARKELVVKKVMWTAHLTVVTLALAGCGNGNGNGNGGGDGTVSAEAYVQTLCANMQTYIDEVTSLSTDFAAEIDPAASLDEQRNAVLSFLDDVLAATDRLIAGVEDAGVPDIDNGQDVVVAIEETFAEARGILEDARAQVETISVDDPQAFAEQLNEIGTTIQTSLGEIGSSLAEIDAPELNAAVSDDRDCAAVAGAAG